MHRFSPECTPPEQNKTPRPSPERSEGRATVQRSPLRTQLKRQATLRNRNTRGARSRLGQLRGCVGGRCDPSGGEDATARVTTSVSRGRDINWRDAKPGVVRTQECKTRISCSDLLCRHVVGNSIDNVSLRARRQQGGIGQCRSVAHHTQGRPRPVRAVAKVRERQVAAPDLALSAREGASTSCRQRGRRRQSPGDGWLSGIEGGSILVENPIDSV